MKRFVTTTIAAVLLSLMLPTDLRAQRTLPNWEWGAKINQQKTSLATSDASAFRDTTHWSVRPALLLRHRIDSFLVLETGLEYFSFNYRSWTNSVTLNIHYPGGFTSRHTLQYYWKYQDHYVSVPVILMPTISSDDVRISMGVGAAMELPLMTSVKHWDPRNDAMRGTPSRQWFASRPNLSLIAKMDAGLRITPNTWLSLSAQARHNVGDNQRKIQTLGETARVENKLQMYSLGVGFVQRIGRN